MTRPTNFNQERTFGIEIEFVGSRSDVYHALIAKGIECEVEGYNHTTQTYWKLTTDASVDDGYELVSPILKGDSGIAALKKVCEALEETNCSVNRSCGLHVHLHAADADFSQVKNFTKLYVKHEPAMDSIMPPSRRGSGAQYVRSNLERHTSVESALSQISRATNMNDLASAVCGSNRYHKLNTQSFWNYGTIEVRHHSGTIEFEKISNWIKLLHYTFDIAGDFEQIRAGGGENISNLTKYADVKVSRFYAKRKRQFANRAA